MLYYTYFISPGRVATHTGKTGMYLNVLEKKWYWKMYWKSIPFQKCTWIMYLIFFSMLQKCFPLFFWDIKFTMTKTGEKHKTLVKLTVWFPVSNYLLYPFMALIKWLENESLHFKYYSKVKFKPIISNVSLKIYVQLILLFSHIE